MAVSYNIITCISIDTEQPIVVNYPRQGLAVPLPVRVPIYEYPTFMFWSENQNVGQMGLNRFQQQHKGPWGRVLFISVCICHFDSLVIHMSLTER